MYWVLVWRLKLTEDSINPHNKPTGPVLLLSPLNRWKKWGWQKLETLLRTTKPEFMLILPMPFCLTRTEQARFFKCTMDSLSMTERKSASTWTIAATKLNCLDFVPPHAPTHLHKATRADGPQWETGSSHLTWSLSHLNTLQPTPLRVLTAFQVLFKLLFLLLSTVRKTFYMTTQYTHMYIHRNEVRVSLHSSHASCTQCILCSYLPFSLPDPLYCLHPALLCIQCLPQLLKAVWPWSSYLTSLCLRFLSW